MDTNVSFTTANACCQIVVRAKVTELPIPWTSLVDTLTTIRLHLSGLLLKYWAQKNFRERFISRETATKRLIWCLNICSNDPRLNDIAENCTIEKMLLKITTFISCRRGPTKVRCNHQPKLLNVSIHGSQACSPVSLTILNQLICKQY